MTARVEVKAASATRPWVMAFAEAMEAKLDENRHKGDREGWARESPRWLLRALEHEVEELRAALHEPCPACGRRKPFAGAVLATRQRQVLKECADVANFAMMIADVAGGLAPPRRRAGKGGK